MNKNADVFVYYNSQNIFYFVRFNKNVKLKFEIFIDKTSTYNHVCVLYSKPHNNMLLCCFREELKILYQQNMRIKMLIIN